MCVYLFVHNLYLFIIFNRNFWLFIRFSGTTLCGFEQKLIINIPRIFESKAITTLLRTNFQTSFEKHLKFAIEMHFVAYNFQTIPEHSIVLFTIIQCNVMCYVDTIWQTCHCSYGIRAHVHRELG